MLGITMILSIALTAWLGWWIAGFAPATALLFGALIAPTDPVLASEIQVGAPSRGSENAETVSDEDPSDQKEDEFRFALTSEAGLNDGLAFPFVNAALAMAIASANPEPWLSSWLTIDVLYKLTAGIGCGWLLGWLLGRVILRIPAATPTAKAMVGPGALAATLLIYGTTELAGAYGFVAVFVGALAIRSNRREHAYHESLHTFAEMIERLLTAGILVAFGGAVAGGLLASLDGALVIIALLTVVVVRPLAGMVGLAGYQQAHRAERWAISFFGVRGVGSFFYLAYALNRYPFADAEKLWALTGLVVVISIFVHGIAAAPVTGSLDRSRTG
ncbi:MAG: sodium:proton antiporter [Verrucomicrobiaceae bacterium]|nr:MAG: sodium:proton antiporter [Verrucomicrobiaceae bacterium]